MDYKKKWNGIYAQKEFIYGEAENEFLKYIVDSDILLPCSNVLCIAEGEGRNAVFLAKKGHNVTAFDFSINAKNKATDLMSKHGVEIDYCLSDINDFKFGENKWDAIISIFAHNNEKTRCLTYSKIEKSLKNNGIIILESYHPNQLKMNYDSGGPKNEDWLVSLNEVLRAFGGFQILHAEEIERNVVEGLYHTGKAYVTQFVGRKLVS